MKLRYHRARFRKRQISAWPSARPLARSLSFLFFSLMMLCGLQLGAEEEGGQDSYARGRALMEQREKTLEGYGDEWDMILITQLKGGAVEWKRKVERRLLEGPHHTDLSMLKFVAPRNICGTGLLTHDHPEGEDDQWLYLPAVRMTRRIAASGRSERFVGSELTYEDLTVWQVNDYAYYYTGQEEVNGRALHVIEATPKEADSGDSKVVHFLDPGTLQIQRTRYFDRKGALLKIAEYKGYERVEERWWRYKKMIMHNQQTGKVTIVEFWERKIGIGLSRKDFTLPALERPPQC